MKTHRKDGRVGPSVKSLQIQGAVMSGWVRSLCGRKVRADQLTEGAPTCAICERILAGRIVRVEAN